jgi:hypothetical protein
MKLIKILNHIIIVPIIGFLTGNVIGQQTYVYNVAKLNSPIVIDADWNKTAWQGVDSIMLENRMGDLPDFVPITHVKMLYDDLNVYVIFKVQDRFVRIVTNEINGPVWEDACAEFFFSPDMAAPLKYFNLETTGGGTPLMCYNTFPLELHYLDTTDIQEIEMAHSLPELVPNEITDSVTWTLEYKVPLELLEKYANVTRPAPGINWMANFYKCASNNSNHHYYTWAKVVSPNPNFHLPQYFGKLVFVDPTLTETVDASPFELYPNPASDHISIKGLNKAATLKIYNVLGHQEALFTNVTERVDISALKEGIYFLDITDGEKNITKKFVKK